MSLPTYNNNGNPSFTLYNYNSNTTLPKTPQEQYNPLSPSSFQLFSPPNITLEDGMILSELLQQEDLFFNNHSNKTVAHQHSSLHSDIRKCGNKNGNDDGFNKPKNSPTRKRSLKNDRHSKINTARGLRDRRMRLPLNVAKKFFKLQDLLGYDKASKTVDWLLMQSKSNIQELSIPMDFSNFKAGNMETQSTEIAHSSSNQKNKKKAFRGVRKSSYLLRPLAKETREMARKRARDRTMKKSSKFGCVSGGDDQSLKAGPFLDQATDQGLNSLESWTTNQPELLSSHNQLTGSWSPSFLPNYQQAGVISYEHQFNDFHMLGNLWEIYN